MANKVNVDICELIYAFQDYSGAENFLDTKTGEIIHISEFMDEEEKEKISMQIESETKRYLFIPSEDSSEAYNDMLDFAATLSSEDLKEKLSLAFKGKGVFRRFKDVLSNYPDERNMWFGFKEGRTKERVNEWLEENNIKCK